MEPIMRLNDGDLITVNLFGAETQVTVFSTGDNRFDEAGSEKDEGFALNTEELDCLNRFLSDINIADYKTEIMAYCNEQYAMMGDIPITEAELDTEVTLSAIAVNISTITQALDGFVYPEISFLGECECDPEHGICVGFRDGAFLGVHAQDWTL